jgi:hypothetical protein
MDGWMDETGWMYSQREKWLCRWKKSALGMSPKMKKIPRNSLGLPLHRSDAALLCF